MFKKSKSAVFLFGHSPPWRPQCVWTHYTSACAILQCWYVYHHCCARPCIALYITCTWTWEACVWINLLCIVTCKKGWHTWTRGGGECIIWWQEGNTISKIMGNLRPMQRDGVIQCTNSSNNTPDQRVRCDGWLQMEYIWRSPRWRVSTWPSWRRGLP